MYTNMYRITMCGKNFKPTKLRTYDILDKIASGVHTSHWAFLKYVKIIVSDVEFQHILFCLD